MNKFKPMKPASKLISPYDMKIWPKLASTKFDGIRAVTSPNGVLSNSLKQIPNRYVQEQLAKIPIDIDGELVLRGEAGKCYDNNQSAFMSRDGKPDFVLKAFDCATYPTKPFYERLQSVHDYCNVFSFVEPVGHNLVYTPEEVLVLYEAARVFDYEGLILRDPNAPYKYGRSTVNQEWGLKMKPFDPDEAIVVGFTELYHNENESKENEMGNNVRSSHKDNKVAGNTLGALICDYKGKEFKIGTGFSAAQRKSIWMNKESYKDKYVRFKHQGITKVGVPRGPAVFLGWRDAIDIGDC